MNKQSGYLMRTKMSSSDEGGVAAGFAVLDSPYLTWRSQQHILLRVIENITLVHGLLNNFYNMDFTYWYQEGPLSNEESLYS